ncbi:MAG TPA: tetratricopeptide repeat protein [Burkholderiales bacterium]|nr:tetratricopeptide repeat protein [Burkholderiales bacterium]
MVLPDIAAQLREAATLFREGKLREAERAYRAVLRGAPENADALFMIGSIALQSGRAKQAASLLERAVRRKPLQPEFHVALGNALRRLARVAEAEESYRRALALRPSFPEVRLNLGHLLSESGRHEEALAEYEAALAANRGFLPARVARARALHSLKRFDAAQADADAALAADPRHPDALHLRAQALLARGDLGAAELDLRRALDADPRHAGALNDLGVLLEQRGALGEAERYYRRAIAVHPAFIDALRNLARLCLGREQWRDAGRLWMRLLRLRPDDGQALVNTAYCLQKVGKPKLAAQYYERRLGQAPADLLAMNNLASSLLAQGRFAEAEAGYREVLGRDPGNAEAIHNLGRALYSQQRLDDAEALLQDAWHRRPDQARIAASIGELQRARGRAEEASDWFRRALTLDPALESAEESLAWALLTTGDFAAGWALQRKVRAREARWRARVARFPQPEWQGEPLAGKRLLVWAEQGLGDQIMFLNALRDVQAQAAHVVLEASPRLVSLFARSFPAVEVVASGARPHERLLGGDIDVQCGMSALPWFTRPGWDAFPDHRGYLAPEAKRVGRWREKLAPLGPGRKIGISWRGGTTATGGERRSTPLSAWRPLLGHGDARFVSVQYGDVGADIAALEREGVRIVHWPEAAADMEEHAALVASLDLVITVCNTAVHMAGALGVPAWALVPARPGWRYLQKGSRMPWYPQVRLFRQQEPGQWDGVFRALAEGLDAA